MVKTTVRLLGMPEFEAMARRIPELLTQALPDALKAGAVPMFNAAKADIHNVSGDLAEAMSIAEGDSGEADLGGLLGRLTGPNPVSRAGIVFGDKGWYWHLVERGHATAWTKTQRNELHRLKTKKAKKVAGYNFTAARPFLRNAFDANVDTSTEIVAARLRAALKKVGDARG